MPIIFTCSIQTPIVSAPATATKFCMEGFVWWPTGTGAADGLFFLVIGGGTMTVNLGNNSQLAGSVSSSAGSFSLPLYPWVLLDQWAHVAMTHDGTTLKMFVAGILVTSLVCGFSMSSPITLAQLSPNGAQFQGAVPFADECRCIVGQTVYTSNFSPPAAPFTLPFIP